jgi:septal ring factor EnvC (AmiA/AmiB activator)
MGAALHPVDQNRSEPDPATRNNVAVFERPSEPGLTRALGIIAQLEAELAELTTEVRSLREVLARTEHKLGRQDALLRNAAIREGELRAQLAERLI